MIDFVKTNVSWIFDGVGVYILTAIVAVGGFIWNKRGPEIKNVTEPNNQTIHQTVSLNLGNGGNSSTGFQETSPKTKEPIQIEELKKLSSILFIDDDKTFKIVDILKKMGWSNTKLIKDISSLADQNVINANVLFIDIQGVGKLLQHKDEGLGLALAIKRRYPEKKIIIYSAQEDGARFHEALNEADYSLPKTAEPVRFEETIIRVLSK